MALDLDHRGSGPPSSHTHRWIPSQPAVAALRLVSRQTVASHMPEPAPPPLFTDAAPGLGLFDVDDVVDVSTPYMPGCCVFRPPNFPFLLLDAHLMLFVLSHPCPFHVLPSLTRDEIPACLLCRDFCRAHCDNNDYHCQLRIYLVLTGPLWLMQVPFTTDSAPNRTFIPSTVAFTIRPTDPFGAAVVPHPEISRPH